MKARVSSMKNFVLLYKMLLKNQEMVMPKEARDNKLYTVFGGIAVFLIMIPCCVLVGFISYIMTTALLESSGGNQGILFILHLMSACSLVLGINVMIGTFYFSPDIDYLLPLPLKIEEIIGAKFFTAYIAESVMEFMIIFSALLGYLIATGFGIVKVLASIIGIITLPIIPLVYCGMVGLLIMYLTRGIKDRKALNRIVGLVIILLMASIAWSFVGMGGISVDSYVENLVNDNNLFISIMNVLFIHGKILVLSISDNNILYLIGYIVINLVAIIAFLVAAKYLYLPGLYKLKSTSSSKSRDNKVDLEHKVKVRKIGWSYFRKEITILCRTNAYFMNCIIVNLLWPIAIAVILILQRNSDTLNNFIKLYHEGREVSDLILLIGVVLVSVLVTAANSLGSSAFTREGAHFEFVKYIPIDYKIQINVKAIISILFSYGSMVLNILIVSYFIKINFIVVIYFMVISLFGVILITYLGILLDTIHPKLIWDDELNALRGNLNVFFNMSFAMLLGLVFGILGVIMYFIDVLRSLEIYIIFFVVLGCAASVMYRICTVNGKRNIKKLLD